MPKQTNRCNKTDLLTRTQRRGVFFILSGLRILIQDAPFSMWNRKTKYGYNIGPLGNPIRSIVATVEIKSLIKRRKRNGVE